MSKPKLTTEQAQLYNELLVLNWSNPYIEWGDILFFTKSRAATIKETLESLEAKGLLLTGPELVPDKGIVTTFTPITKSGAYGYPADDFKDYSEWMKNEVEVPDAI